MSYLGVHLLQLHLKNGGFSLTFCRSDFMHILIVRLLTGIHSGKGILGTTICGSQLLFCCDETLKGSDGVA